MHFQDESVFTGWREFSTPDGRIRAEEVNIGCWRIYRQTGGAYVHDALVPTPALPTCRELWDAYVITGDAALAG